MALQVTFHAQRPVTAQSEVLVQRSSPALNVVCRMVNVVKSVQIPGYFADDEIPVLLTKVEPSMESDACATSEPLE